MYKHPVRRRTSFDGQEQFYIRRSEIVFDPRVVYIESVCAALLESRFGPGRVEPLVIDHHPELEELFLLERADRGTVPCHSLSPQGRADYRVIDAKYCTAMHRGLVPAVGNSAAPLPPNQGRGSP